MAFWNRNKQVQNSELPEEVREYYQSTQRSRRGSAVLFGLLTLLLTLAIAAALYFAGRFVWQQFFTDEAPAPTSSEQSTEEVAAPPPVSDQESDSESQSSTPSTLPGDSTESESTESSGTSSTNSTLTQTPDTGPGDVIALFVGTVLVAALAYEVLARKKQVS